MKDYHSVYDLNYHLILVVKSRKKVITDEISKELEQDFTRIGKTYGITPQEWNHDQDHIHVLFTAQPMTEISKFLNSYKSASSRLVKKNHPEIREYLWKQAFWNKSYYLATTGGVSIDTLKTYIQTQGEDA